MKKRKRWHPKAKRRRGRYPGRMTGKGARMIVLHTSESDPGSINGVTNWVRMKNTEYHLSIDDKLKVMHQYFPFNKAARSLENGGINGGAGCNKSGEVVIQICIVGRAKNNPVAHLSPWAVRQIKEIARSWGVPLVVVNDGRSLRSWNSKDGVRGHKNAPNNSHTDPGRIPPNLFGKRVAMRKVHRRLRKGHKGVAVKKLQRALGIKPDGDFGRKTERKVKKFQRQNKLKPTGVVGKRMWRKLGYQYIPPKKGRVTKNSNTRWPTNKKLMNGLRLIAGELDKTIHIVSGYRSWSEQNRLYQGWIRRLPGYNLAAKPGSSRHNYGNAADCGVIVNGRYISIGDYPPARRLLSKYGLHLPVAGEAWHTEAK